MSKIIGHYSSLLLVGLVVSSGTQAQEDFTIQGLKVGMPESDILSKSEDMKSSDINRDERIFRTPQGEELEETIHTSRISWQNAEKKVHNSYFVNLTRKPMEPKAHQIARTASYEGLRDVNQRPTLEMYKKSVLEKYGDPIDGREEISHTHGQVFYWFAEGTLPEHCPSVYRYPYKTVSKIEGCPPVLEVELSFLNQPNHPMKYATFTMYDRYLAAKDNVEFQPYWNQWMEDYLASKKTTAEEPEL